MEIYPLLHIREAISLLVLPLSVSAPSLELLENSPPLSVSLTLTSGTLGLSLLLFFSKASRPLQLLPRLAGKHVDKTGFSAEWFLSSHPDKLTKTKPDHLVSVIEKTQLVSPYLLDKILMRHGIRIIYHLSRFITPSFQNPCPPTHTHTHTHTELTIHSNRTLCLSHFSPGSFMPPCLDTNYCLECFVLVST